MGLILAAGNIMGAFVAVKVNLSETGAQWVKWTTLVMAGAILIRLIAY